MDTRQKYPRTYHFPWSPGVASDDKIIESLDFFKDRRVILTEKKDGENTSMYTNWIHARSLDSRHHPSRDWVKTFWASIRHMIPEGYRICGENLYAQHSIAYSDLSSYFYAFSVWDENNSCLAWDDAKIFCDIIGIETVPVLYDGMFDEKVIRDICESLDPNKVEGAVLRVADDFHFDFFNKAVAKFVRKGHVQTDQHWMNQKIVPNRLTSDK